MTDERHSHQAVSDISKIHTGGRHKLRLPAFYLQKRSGVKNTAAWCGKNLYGIHGRGLPRLVSVVRLEDKTNNPEPVSHRKELV